MTFELNFKTNVDQFQRKVSAFAYKQLPFATAQALTQVAKQVSAAEQVNEEKVLDRPRPFTTGALFVVGAKKDRLTALLIMKDLTARYLEPYEFGGRNVLNSRALLKPIGAMKDLDQYGNLPRNFIAKLKGREDIFVGSVNTKRGIVNGIWQRTADAGTAVPVSRIGKNGQVRITKTRKGLNTSGHLKLLVKFDDAHNVKQHLDWFGVARRTADKNFNQVMGRALARAIATAK